MKRAKDGSRKSGRKKKYNLNSRIKSALRKLWFWSPMRAEVVKAAKVGKSHYLCGTCKRLFPKIEVDHIEPCGFSSTWDEYIAKLFCDPKGLRVLCKTCHNDYTKEFLNANTKHEKSKTSKSPAK